MTRTRPVDQTCPDDDPDFTDAMRVLHAGNVHPGPDGYTIVQLQRALAARNWTAFEFEEDPDGAAGVVVRASKRRRGVAEVAMIRRRGRNARMAWVLVLAAAIADDQQWKAREPRRPFPSSPPSIA